MTTSSDMERILNYTRFRDLEGKTLEDSGFGAQVRQTQLLATNDVIIGDLILTTP